MGGRLRNLWAVLLAALITGAAAWLLYAVWRSPHRIDLATYGAFAVALVVPVVGWIALAWRRRAKQQAETPGLPELDHLADLLAEAVREQWEKEAGARRLLEPEPLPVRWRMPSQAVAGPVAAAVGSTRFPPLPGLRGIKAQDLRVGDIRSLHAVYGGLGSGRLVITGAPGSGKSGTAVRLVLDAVRHRQGVPKKVRLQVPVPVLFTAQDWDPIRERLQDWLAQRMQETYRLFTGKTGALCAAALIAAGKVAVILDGLDEIAEGLRPAAMQALSQQAVFRVVVLVRTAEMASAASQRGMLEGAAAVELQDVDQVTAAEYLSRVQLDPPPDGWRDLVDRVRTAPGSSLARALGSPLTLTLVRDTYLAGDDVRELLAVSDAVDGRASGDDNIAGIVDYLLGRVLPAAYARQPGNPPPRYDLQTAQNALRQLAAQMHVDGTRDFEWWRIHMWAPRMPRVITAGVTVGVVAVAVAVIVAGFWPGLQIGAEIGALGGFLVWQMTGPRSGSPSRLGKLQLRQIFRRESFLPALVVASACALLLGIVEWVERGVVVGLVTGLVFWLAMMVLFGLIVGLPDWGSTGSLSPLASWRSDSRYGLVFGLLIAVLFWLAAGVLTGLEWHRVGLVTKSVTVLAAGLGIGLMFSLVACQTWASGLVFIQLAWRWHTPVRLMRFLDDAHERNVLRTFGPVYQFRHARLQDCLAAGRTMAGDEDGLRPPPRSG